MYCLSRAWLFVHFLFYTLARPVVPVHAALYDADRLGDSGTGQHLRVTSGDQPGSLGNVLQETKVTAKGRQSGKGKLEQLVAVSTSSGVQLGNPPDGHQTATTGAPQQQQAPTQNLAPEHRTHATAAVSTGPGLWLDALWQRVQNRAHARREIKQRQLLQQPDAGDKLLTSDASHASSIPENSEPGAASDSAANASDATGGSEVTSTTLGSRSRSASATAAVQTDGGTPYSCRASSYKYAQLEVVLNMPVPAQLSVLEDKVSTAIAQQLRLTDNKGNVDASRVETYVVTVDDSNESVDLDVFIYFSSNNCEVFTHTWMQSMQDDPARLFRTDSRLQSDVVNVTANFDDPGRASKQLILASRNAVISVSLGVQAAADNSTDSSSAGTSLYDWFYTSTAVSKLHVDGLMVLGISTSALIFISVLLVLLRRYARGRARQRAEAEVTAAAQAAASAARQQAALDVPEQERDAPHAAAADDAADT